MGLSSGELAQIVWAETKGLPPGKPDGTGDVNGIRRLVAQLAASVDGAGFDRRDPLPSLLDANWGDTSRGIMAISETAKDAAAPQSRLIVWEASDTTTRPVAASNALPAPWGNILVEAVTYQGRYPIFGGRNVDIFSRAPLEGDTDGTPFVNAVTGTGMPNGKPLLIARSSGAQAKPKTGIRFFLIALALFLVAAVWAYGIGLASQLTMAKFSATATVAPAAEGSKVDCNPAPPTGIDFPLGPEKWRPTADIPNQCGVLFAAARQRVSDDSERTWIEYFAARSLAASGSSGSSVSLAFPLALGFLSFAFLFASAGYGTNGRPMGAIIDERYRMSLTLTQAVLWAVVILGAWLVLGLYNIGFGGVAYNAVAQAAAAAPGNTALAQVVEGFLVFPTIPTELWCVLGLAAGTPFLSRLVSKTNIVAPAGASEPALQGAAATPSYLSHNTDASQAKLGDMVLNETAHATDLVDATRVQHAAITGILVVSYAMLLFGTVSTIEPIRVALAFAATRSVFSSMPAVDGTFLTLLFTSHAALIIGKAFDKKTTEPSATAPPTR